MKKSALTSSMMFAAVLAFAAGGVYAQRGTAPHPNGLSVESGRVVLTRYHTTLLLQPYAPNIIRVSISRLKPYALAAPGYGISAKPNAHGWKFAPGSGGGTYRSSRCGIHSGVSRHSAASAASAPHQPVLQQYRRAGLRSRAAAFPVAQRSHRGESGNWFMYRPSNGSGNTESSRTGVPPIRRFIRSARPSAPGTASSITAWAKTSRAGLTIAISKSSAGAITARRAARVSACLFL